MADHFYVYPGYLLVGGSRAAGRRVAKADALAHEVPLEELVRAARALGVTAEAEPEKNYPRLAHRFQGRIKVTKRAGLRKAEFLKTLAREVARAPPAGRAP